MGHTDVGRGSARTEPGPGVIHLVAGGRADAQFLFLTMPFAFCFGKGSSMEAEEQIRLLSLSICPEWEHLFRNCRVVVLLPLVPVMHLYLCQLCYFHLFSCCGDAGSSASEI